MLALVASFLAVASWLSTRASTRFRLRGRLLSHMLLGSSLHSSLFRLIRDRRGWGVGAGGGGPDGGDDGCTLMLTSALMISESASPGPDNRYGLVSATSPRHIRDMLDSVHTRARNSCRSLLSLSRWMIVIELDEHSI